MAQYVNPLRLTTGKYNLLIAIERAADFGVFDTTADLDDFKKSELASILATTEERIHSETPIYISEIPFCEDKYIICNLLRHIDTLTSTVNDLNGEVARLKETVNLLVIENNRPSQWISLI